MTDDEQIAWYLAEKLVTKCPTAYAAATSAAINPVIQPTTPRRFKRGRMVALHNGRDLARSRAGWAQKGEWNGP